MFYIYDSLLSSIFSFHATSSSSSFLLMYLVVCHVKKEILMFTDAMFDLAMGYICTLLPLVSMSAYYVV